MHVLTGACGAPAVAGFTFGDQAITTRLTSGNYPSMAAMIPAGFAATAVLDTGELAEAVNGWRSWPPAKPPSTCPSAPARPGCARAAAMRPTAPTPSAASWTATR